MLSEGKPAKEEKKNEGEEEPQEYKEDESL